MLKRSTPVGLTGWALAVLCFMAVLPAAAWAKTELVAVEGVGYNVEASLADNLTALVGKKVYVTLDSGKTLTGFVKAVGNHLLHLEKLAGKDYFDALIRIEDIGAIDTRFRDIKR